MKLGFEEILSRLENVQRCWGYYKARCPAHEDRRNSLSLKEGKYIQCHAGCTYEEVMEALSESDVGDGAFASAKVGSVGNEERPSLSESGPRPADPNDFPMVYDYVDEKWKLLFRMCRSWKKDFFPCHPDPDSPTGFYWGLGGARRVIYRLPRVLGAIAAGEVVYVVEGEKDTRSVEKAGGIATCNPFGAGKWREEYNDFFVGASVVIVSDMDAAGTAHAEKVLNNLIEVEGIDVTVVLPRTGKDVSDHLEAGFALSDLMEVADALS